MTVKELIDKLSKFNGDDVIKFKCEEYKPQINVDIDYFDYGYPDMEEVIHDIDCVIKSNKRKKKDRNNIYLCELE